MLQVSGKKTSNKQPMKQTKTRFYVQLATRQLAIPFLPNGSVADFKLEIIKRSRKEKLDANLQLFTLEDPTPLDGNTLLQDITMTSPKPTFTIVAPILMEYGDSCYEDSIAEPEPPEEVTDEKRVQRAEKAMKAPNKIENLALLNINGVENQRSIALEIVEANINIINIINNAPPYKWGDKLEAVFKDNQSKTNCVDACVKLATSHDTTELVTSAKELIRIVDKLKRVEYQQALGSSKARINKVLKTLTIACEQKNILQSAHCISALQTLSHGVTDTDTNYLLPITNFTQSYDNVSKYFDDLQQTVKDCLADE